MNHHFVSKVRPTGPKRLGAIGTFLEKNFISINLTENDVTVITSLLDILQPIQFFLYYLEIAICVTGVQRVTHSSFPTTTLQSMSQDYLNFRQYSIQQNERLYLGLSLIAIVVATVTTTITENNRTNPNITSRPISFK